MKIIYQGASGTISIVSPTGVIPVSEVAKKDVPHGVPYLIVEDSDLPSDWSTSAAWEVDFSSPDGIGMGPQRYFIAQAEAVLADPDASESDKAAAAALKTQMEAEL